MNLLTKNPVLLVLDYRHFGVVGLEIQVMLWRLQIRPFISFAVAVRVNESVESSRQRCHQDASVPVYSIT